MVRISIPADLYQEWRPVLERQIDLALAGVRGQLHQLRVRFGATAVPGCDDVIFRCEVRGRSVAGRIYRHTARSTNGRTAIRDALNRTRRAIARDRQLRYRSHESRGPSIEERRSG